MYIYKYIFHGRETETKNKSYLGNTTHLWETSVAVVSVQKRCDFEDCDKRSGHNGGTYIKQKKSFEEKKEDLKKNLFFSK